jgi:hypothetical protein
MWFMIIGIVVIFGILAVIRLGWIAHKNKGPLNIFIPMFSITDKHWSWYSLKRIALYYKDDQPQWYSVLANYDKAIGNHPGEKYSAKTIFLCDTNPKYKELYETDSVFRMQINYLQR